MLKVFLASRNEGKLLELRALLKGMKLDFADPISTGIYLSVEEDGLTYAENAARKASAYARGSGMLTIADDSGLEVESLNGEPGLYSARYAPWSSATDADRRIYLLTKLDPYPRPWKACFRCVVAILEPGSEVHFSEGICRGEIIPEERGQAGFGYDPIFEVDNTQKTMAELTLSQKNRLSHRGKAIQAARPIILELLNKPSF